MNKVKLVYNHKRLLIVMRNDDIFAVFYNVDKIGRGHSKLN